MAAMNVFERLQRAFDTQVGFLFLALILTLLLLGIIYWLLMFRKKKRDLNAFHHRSYYEKADKIIPYRPIAHQADFFGRRSVVISPDNTFGVSLVPPPDLATLAIKEKYRRFSRAIENRHPPLIFPSLWKNDEESWAIVQKGQLRPDGRYLLNLKYYLSGSKLLQTEKEKLLLELAKSLGQLHKLSTEAGEQLYHGFLIPSSLYLNVDENKIICGLTLADAGVSFSIGPEKILERLNLLKKGRLPIEKFKGLELIEQMRYFAPEQLDNNRANEVGQKSDFYLFGKLAMEAFKSQLPQDWQRFIKACLEERPSDRPGSFSELEDRLSDPELALSTAFDNAVDVSGDRELEAADLLAKMKKLKEISVTKGGNLVQEGIRACREARWSPARKLLQEAVKDDSKCAIAHAYLAIAFYELGEMKQAQKHYERAKELNPVEAKRFREHIALRI